MRVLFMGGKYVGCECFKYLLKTQEVVGVVVNPSDVDLGQWYPSIYRTLRKAHHAQIPVFDWRDVNSPEAVGVIKALRPDMIVVVYFDQILKAKIIEIPPKGCINLHLALSEDYRGCYPTTWALINGETSTGVTLHYIDEGIDSGNIIAQQKIEIAGEDTGETLYYECSDTGIQMFKSVFPSIVDGSIKSYPQDNSHFKYHNRAFPSQEMDFNKSGKAILNHIRAMLFGPFPRPYFLLGEKKYEIVEVESE